MESQWTYGNDRQQREETHSIAMPSASTHQQQISADHRITHQLEIDTTLDALRIRYQQLQQMLDQMELTEGDNTACRTANNNEGGAADTGQVGSKRKRRRL